MLELTLLVLGFIAASGFFALIDAAILNVSPAEVEVLISKKRWGARELKSLLRHTTRAIIVIVIFTNITNILGPILAGQKAIELFGSHVIGYMTALLTLLTIVFSEIIPKSIGAHNAPRIARRVAPFLHLIILALYPLVIALERLVRLFRKSAKRKVGTEEQIRALANIGGGEGHIDADEREWIHRAFVLNDRKARDVMTPLRTVIAVQKDMTVRKAATLIFVHHYSRYPVIGTSLDDLYGYVLSLDVLEALATGRGEESVSALMRKMLIVEGSLGCDELVNMLRKEVSQFAIVKDEGKTAGLVTLEDVLEELVGEIRHE